MGKVGMGSEMKIGITILAILYIISHLYLSYSSAEAIKTLSLTYRAQKEDIHRNTMVINELSEALRAQMMEAYQKEKAVKTVRV